MAQMISICQEFMFRHHTYGNEASVTAWRELIEQLRKIYAIAEAELEWLDVHRE